MNLGRKTVAVIVCAVVLIVGTMAYVFLRKDTPVLRLATTTSTYDSGLLDYILPEFENLFECEVDVIAVGSGQAMEMGKRGDVDILLVHSPSAELAFMDGGYGESRTSVMYNNYVLVGPASDPAGIDASANATDAFQRIHNNGTAGLVQFVSRGDNSGTHNKELSIWKSLDLNVSYFDDNWYLSAGQGMGAVLDMCEELDAYTLSDDATYYQRASENLVPNLAITYNLEKTDATLRNQYSVIPVNSTMWPHVDHTLASAFKDWIVSEGGQDLIASYERFGQQLFYPNAPGYVPSTASLGALPDSLVDSARSVPKGLAAIALTTSPGIRCARW